MADQTPQIPAGAEKHVRTFKKSLPMQMRLHEAIRSLGETKGETCLDIGSDNGMMCYHLRKRGGNWSSVALTEAMAASLREVVPDNVVVLEEMALPFKKQTFDAVVILGHLEDIAADDAFIEECHRVLKTDGRLVIHVPHIKEYSLVNLLRKVLGLTPEKLGNVRAGYSESDLFRILKHGFDVHNMRSYSRFFMEFTDTLVNFFAVRGAGADSIRRKTMHANSVLKPLYWVAFQLDILLFFTRGHHLIGLARRRAWRPRNAPVLVDGRSISEAVLSKTAD